LMDLSPSMRVMNTTAILFLHLEHNIFSFIDLYNILSFSGNQHL